MATIEDFQKLDIRVGKIIEILDFPEAKKPAYKLKIDLGTETRTLVAGLKKYYTAQELEGKRIIVFTNLEPKTLKGIESKGMVLAAVKDNNVTLITPDKDIEIGAKIQ